MQERWLILLVLFFARTTMAFQFQAVGALSPAIVDSLAFTLADIGLLIGLYLGPGVIVATMGGTVAAWFGDKRIGFASLLLMAAGGVLVAVATNMPLAITGRVISGIGGVVVNVLMTKMVLDWFAGHNTATAMSLFISSWSLGIALALLILPSVEQVGGLRLAGGVVVMATLVALLLFSLVYRPAGGADPGSGKVSVTSLPWKPLSLAAAIWAFYNAAFAMMFGFGTLVLVARGFSATEASSATSLNILAGTIGIPLGGWLADRTGRRDAVILLSLVAGVVMYPALLYLPVSYSIAILVAGGFVVGFAPGPVVSMPGEVLPANARAFGTGVFYSMYYVVMMIAPPLAGVLADRLANVNVAFLMASGMMAISIVALAGYRCTVRKRARN